jgi:hypothetical protein
MSPGGDGQGLERVEEIGRVCLTSDTREGEADAGS